MKRATLLLAVVALVAAGVGPPASHALALDVTDLGKTTNDVPVSAPLGNFHYIRTSLHHQFKPELLFIGLDDRDTIEDERWPVVKALDQFGTFSGVEPWPAEFPPCPCERAFPGFNLDHASYRSRYVALANKDLLTPYFKPLARLTREELRLFNKYSNPDGPRANLYKRAALDAAANVLTPHGPFSLPGSYRSLPLVVVGGYAQTWPTDPVFVSDFVITNQRVTTPCPTAYCSGSTMGTLQNAPFSSVQQSLVTGKAVDGLPGQLVSRVNAATNVIITLICHADGKKPKSVCNRAVIRKLMKYVK